MTPAVPAPTRPWAFAAAALVGLAGVVSAAPLLGGVGEGVRFAFSHVCHQIPERSLWVGGGPVALCHRCFGVLGGLVVAVAAGPLMPGLRRTRNVRAGRWLTLALVPGAIDWLLGAMGVWANTPASRLATGALFGAVAGLVLAESLLAPRAPASPTAAPPASAPPRSVLAHPSTSP